MMQPQELETFFTELAALRYERDNSTSATAEKDMQALQRPSAWPQEVDPMSNAEQTLGLDSHCYQRQDLDAFFDGLAVRRAVFQDAKQQMDRYIASDFDVFSYMKVEERRLSHILGDLLDPKGPHGQGDTFLRKFLHLIDCETGYHSGDDVTVCREVATYRIQRTQRRLDVLIDIRRDGQSREGIAIENKPWALDQDEQIAAYIAHLAGSYSNGHYRLIYLTPDGAMPPPYSVGKNAADGWSSGNYCSWRMRSVPAIHPSSTGSIPVTRSARQRKYVGSFEISCNIFNRTSNLKPRNNTRGTHVETLRWQMAI